MNFLAFDNWFVVSSFCNYRDLINLSIASKPINIAINQPRIWEQQCRRFFNTDFSITSNNNINQNVFKSHFKHFVEKYGHESVFLYRRVIRCWKLIIRWCETYLPRLRETFNDPASTEKISKLQKWIHTRNANENRSLKKKNLLKFPTAYLIFLGECSNGQKYSTKRTEDRLGFYGYYEFYQHSSTSRLQMIDNCMHLTSETCNNFPNPLLNDLYAYAGALPRSRDCNISHFCLTYIRLTDGKLVKITSTGAILDSIPNNSSFLEHLEWYTGQLMHSNYRVTDDGILRFPLKSESSSECVSHGIVCRGSPLFISEHSNSSHSHSRYVFPYRIEIECPKEDESIPVADEQNCAHGQLTIRKWRIECNGKVERVEGPGVIGLYPRVFAGQELFAYQSCSQQSHPVNGRMWGSFIFKKDNSDETFELKIEPYLLDITKCQWV